MPESSGEASRIGCWIIIVSSLVDVLVDPEVPFVVTDETDGLWRKVDDRGDGRYGCGCVVWVIPAWVVESRGNEARRVEDEADRCERCLEEERELLTKRNEGQSWLRMSGMAATLENSFSPPHGQLLH